MRFLSGNWARIESVRKELGYITDVERLMKGTHSLHQLNFHENGAIGPIGMVSTQTFFLFLFFLIQENSNLYKPRGHGSTGGGLETSRDEESIT